MYNYNVINPANIYQTRYYKQNETAKTADANKESKTPVNDKNKNQRRFPNGNKVAIDYTKNQVNIAQVLQDFRSTIAAINSPEDIKNGVEDYLTLVDKESKKDTPSREIILSNLKNAARITDKYIEDSLKKPSTVVLNWVSALFEQNINLKSDPNQINEDFRVKIPKNNSANKQQTETNDQTEQTADGTVTLKEIPEAEKSVSAKVLEQDFSNAEIANIETLNGKEDNANLIKKPETNKSRQSSIYEPKTEKEILAKEAYALGKKSIDDDNDIYKALKMYDRAVNLIEDSNNQDLRSAIYFERGKIFDTYDYPELALADYNKATKATDGNLRAQAHIKMGNIYDDYTKFDPALTQYSLAIESAEDADNPYGKTRALRYIASMLAGIYDENGTESFNELAIESAKETQNPSTIAKTYLEAAKNYEYIGQDSKALQTYAALAKETSVQEDYSTLASNYKEASILMAKKGNIKKSAALLRKAEEYSMLAGIEA